jgi:RNA recognition motif-containing protein
MNNKLFVGNLSFKVTETELQEVFSQAGAVVSVSIPTDKYTGKKRGFGFVEMSSQEEAEQAIKALNGRALAGREMSVNLARPKEKSSDNRSRAY